MSVREERAVLRALARLGWGRKRCWRLTAMARGSACSRTAIAGAGRSRGLVRRK